MAFSINPGVWPVMITPWTEDNKPDFKAIKQLCDWYVEKGCTGIFAVCQSSEMAYLTEQEKLDIARATAEAVDGRIQVVASGHTADDKATQFREIENMMKIPGIGAYVLVSNRLDQKNEGEAVFEANAQEIFDRYPEIDFGIYECPMPWKRLVSTEFLRKAGQQGRMVFLKDTCCDIQQIKEKLDICRDSNLKLYTATPSTLLESLRFGATGYSGVMANMQCDLYAWLCAHPQDEKAEELSQELTICSLIERQLYPVNAKYYLSLEGLSITTECRSKRAEDLTTTFRTEVEMLRQITKRMADKYL